jgi:site-specific recombinase XerD
VATWVANPVTVQISFQAAADEYLGWLHLEANRSPNTVRAYRSELARFESFLSTRNHSLLLSDLGHDDLRAYQRSLAERGRKPATRSRALVAIRSWLRWLATEKLIGSDLSNDVTLPKLDQRLPKPIPPEELGRLLASLPMGTPLEKRDRALVQFLISTGCRISEALALDRADLPREGNRLVVTGKGAKQRSVYLTGDAHRALEDYTLAREDTCPALFINFDRSQITAGARRLTSSGARHVVNRVRLKLGAWSFRSPHVARHTAATSLLEATGGDVRLVQEVLGHANLNTLAGYTKIVDARKREAYKLYQEYLDQTQKR